MDYSLGESKIGESLAAVPILLYMSRWDQAKWGVKSNKFCLGSRCSG